MSVAINGCSSFDERQGAYVPGGLGAVQSTILLNGDLFEFLDGGREGAASL